MAVSLTAPSRNPALEVIQCNSHLLVHRTACSSTPLTRRSSSNRFWRRSSACAALFTAKPVGGPNRESTRDIPATTARDTADCRPRRRAPLFATLADAGVAAPVPNSGRGQPGEPLPCRFRSQSLRAATGREPKLVFTELAFGLPAPAKPAAATKTKPPHHALGVALAALGTATLALGAAAYAFGRTDICANEHSRRLQRSQGRRAGLDACGGSRRGHGILLSRSTAEAGTRRAHPNCDRRQLVARWDRMHGCQRLSHIRVCSHIRRSTS